MAEAWALVLAAGGSSRFGAAKLLAPWRGGRLLDAALATALEAPVAGVLVVTGEDPAVGAATLEFAAGRADAGRLRLVASEDPREGIAASLRAGVRALPVSAGAALVLLADMPLVPPGLAGEVLAALDGGVLAAAPWRDDGRPGHPAAMSRALFRRLLALTGDRGAGGLLAGLGERMARLPCTAPGAFADVDAPADLARLRALDSAPSKPPAD